MSYTNIACKVIEGTAELISTNNRAKEAFELALSYIRTKSVSNIYEAVQIYNDLTGAGWHVADEAHDEFSAMWERLEDKEGFARINILEYGGKE